MSDEKEPSYITTIRYINYQKIKVNNDLLNTIQIISEEKRPTSPNLLEYNITLDKYKHIKRLINIFSQIPILEKTKEYLYYIFILLNLPKHIIKNINRYFNASVYRQYQIKLPLNYLEIIKKKDKLDCLITNLEFLKNENNEYILFFMDTLNVFFT